MSEKISKARIGFSKSSWKLCFYYKIQHNMCPLYLTELLPIMESHCHSLRSNRPPTVPNLSTESFKSTFPPLVLLIGTNFVQIYKILLHLKFLNEHLLFFIRPKPAGVYKIHHPKGLKLHDFDWALIICVNINFDIILLIQSILSACVVQTALKHIT